MPLSFGLFQNNFTLKGCVCDECNQYFGDNLEIDLGRDTYEGISRFEYGVQNPKEFKSFGKRSRLRLKIAEGILKGALSYLAFSEEHNVVTTMPLPQAGFLDKSTGDYAYYSVDEIPSKSELEQKGLDREKDVRAFGNSFDEIEQALAEKGIYPKFQEEIPLPEKKEGKWLIEFEGSIDKTICRAIAKISFNYLIYWHSVDFALQQSFDPIRSFIRYGKDGISPLVMIRTQNILVDEPSQDSRRIIHIVTVNWTQDGKAIISQVSLFNFLSYTVQLAKNYPGEMRNLRKGHFYNLGDRKIYELTAM